MPGGPPVRHAKAARTACSGRTLAIAVLAVALAAAGFAQLRKGTPPPRQVATAAAAASAAALHHASAGRMGNAPSHPSASLAASINSFGSSLFDAVAAKSEPEGAGLFLSPYGIAQALGMLINGVEPGGESWRQLQAAVYNAGGANGADGLSLEALNSQLKELSAALVKPPSDDITVSDANSAWLAQRYQLQPGFADALAAAFGAGAARPLSGAGPVNAWVSEATRGKIASIVDEGMVAQAIMVLVNAVYFKGLWRHQFDKHATHPLDFSPLQHSQAPFQVSSMFQTFKLPGSPVQVATLSAEAGGGSFECGAVQLPYRGDDYLAVAAVPRGEFGAEAAEGGQRALQTPGGPVPYSQALKACREALLASLPGAGNGTGSLWQVPRADVKIHLPRFEIEFSTSLNTALQALGVRKPFEGGDITKIAADGSGNPVKDLFVSEVVHKVYIKADERGTEAAAATAVIAQAMCLRPVDEVVLKFDRPFVFAVVHKATGLALFCGEVHRPEGWKGYEKP